MRLIEVVIFRGSCSSFPPKERSGGHRLLILPNEINENGAWNFSSLSWKEREEQKDIYNKRANLRGQDISIEKYDKMGRDIRGDYYRFIARSEYIDPDHKAGCNPLLRVQFFASTPCKYLNNSNFVLYKQKK